MKEATVSFPGCKCLRESDKALLVKMDDGEELWWCIYDYQPSPPHNPFAPLRPGKLIIIPSEELVTTEILVTPVEVYL